tara:strand:+ start:1013 stop:2035 length:1023 start_codon:yes stop_codon:yes gene_type:complete
MKNFKPTVLYSTKLINLDNIQNEAIPSQSRVGDYDPENLKNIEADIETNGLFKPISVEVINLDSEDDSKSTYMLRDGNHRLLAYRSLKTKHKNSNKYNMIECTVYNNHSGTHATNDWLQWQHQQNEHPGQVHKCNSYNDSVYTAYMLLVDGYLSKEASELVAADDWDNPTVDKTLKDWIKTNCKGLTVDEVEKMLTDIHKKGDHVRKSKIKRYSWPELDKVYLREFGIESARGVSKSPLTNITVSTASEQDFWVKVLSPVFRIFDEGGKSGKNAIVFHCRKGTVDHIDKRRKKIIQMVDTINSWFSKNIPAFKNDKVIDEVKFLGQKLSPEYGEKDGEFC